MCRMVAYLGEPLRLLSLTDEPEHSLLRQSYAARELSGATVSADGWGAAWYLPGDARPCVYRSTFPIWADVNREDLGRAAHSHCLLAAVRSATDPLSVGHANTQPFSRGTLTLLHNGYIENFTRTTMRALRSTLSEEQYVQLRGNSDSEHLMAVVADEFGATGDLPHAMQRSLGRVRELAERAKTAALLTVIASDGVRMVAARLAVGAKPPSLYLRGLARSASASAWLGSEPLDDADWSSVEPNRLLVLERGQLPHYRDA